MHPIMCGTVLNNKMKMSLKWKYWHFKTLENFSSYFLNLGQQVNLGEMCPLLYHRTTPVIGTS